MSSRGNVLSDFTNFEQVSCVPQDKIWDGKNVFLSWEGTGKTFKTITSAIDIANQSKGKVLIFSQNTIDKMYENYEQAKSIVSDWPIPPRIELLPSTREVYRQLFKEPLPALYETLKNGNDDNCEIFIFSLHKCSYKLATKNTTSYQYKKQSTSSGKIMYHLIEQFSRNNIPSKTIKRDMLVVVARNGKQPFISELTKQMDMYCDHAKSSDNRLVNYIKRMINMKEVLGIDPDIDYCIFSQYDLNYVLWKLKKTIELLHYLKSEHKPEDDSLILFTQHEKLLIELVDYPVEKLSGDYHLIIDEMPHNRFQTFTINQIDKIIKHAIAKDPKEYTIDEYQLMKNFDPKLIDDIRKQAKKSTRDLVINLPINISMHINLSGSYISPNSVISQGKTISPIFGLFKNTLILTTEFLPCAFLETIGYKVFEEIMSKEFEDKFATQEDEMSAVFFPKIDTTKKHTEAMKHYIQTIRKDNPETFIVGKKDLGCDGSFESIKGSNKFWQDDNISCIHIIASPRHPNEVYDYFIKFESDLKDRTPEEFLKLLIKQKCVDDFNQTVARLLGVRKLRSKKKSKVIYFISKTDDISYSAMLNSRYTPDTISCSDEILY